MRQLINIQADDEALLTLTWRHPQTSEDSVEIIAMPTVYAAREALALLSRLAPAARRESLVRQMIKTMPRKPRSARQG